MSVERAALRSCLGCFPTGVTVVTGCTAAGELVGITVNSFSSVSLEPPLVLFSLQRTLHSLPAFNRCSAFAINILRSDQHAVSDRFAGRLREKWDGVAFTRHATGAPLLDGVAAWMACRPYARYDGGDHEIVVGRVLETQYDHHARALVFYRGAYDPPL